MSYKQLTEGNLDDLLYRKEFYSLKNTAADFHDPPDAIDSIIKRKLKIRSHQLFVSNLISPDTPYKRLHLLHGTGTGKCHGRDTPILLHDGNIKKVQDIVVGDLLMGDNNCPRTVLSLASGREQLYKIGNDNCNFICNKSHILTLYDTHDDQLIDVPLVDMLRLKPRDLLRYKMIQVPVNYPEKTQLFNAYKFGLWFGNSKGEYEPPPFSIGDPHIPYIYKCGSYTQRTELMRGILHAGGMHVYDVWRFYTRNPRVADDLLYVCRSLGVRVYLFSTEDLLMNPAYCLVIYDFEKTVKLYAMKTMVVTSDFKIVKLTEDRYYGFTLDGNHRYLLGNFIVTHNTLAATAIASKFIKIYRKFYSHLSDKTQSTRKNYAELDKNTPTVYVFGFGGTKTAFIRDLLKYPEFGFITASERDELVKRQNQTNSGFAEDIKYYKDYYSFLKRRITNKPKNGFFKFYGYDEFVNRLFRSSTVKLTDLESQVLTRMKAGEPVTLEDVIMENIELGNIQVNTSIINQFENSLIICDEIHNTYNMNMKNNRGIAIQYILDMVRSVRFISMSATPINNTPSEIVELINYLVPKENKITKKEFFTNIKNISDEKIDELARLTIGRISFLQDSNLKYFPKRVFCGEDYILDKTIGKLRANTALPYLKFIKCEMSEYHQKTIDDYLRAGGELTDEMVIGEEVLPWHSIPTDGYSVYDMVFPNPEGELGLFKTSETKNKILAAPAEWRERVGINFRKYSVLNTVYTGTFLQYDNLKTYSAKYAKMVDLIKEIIAGFNSDINRAGKIMIYHNRVKMSGVLIIQEILKYAGILDEVSEPVDNTLCICGHTLSEHKNAKDHEFIPIRYVTAHSDMDKTIMEQNLVKYNALDNAHGKKFMILIGSKIIKESFDFKDIQHMIITSMPINIPTLLQVLGRGIRTFSHINLPPEQRVTNIHILVSTSRKNAYDSVSPEMYRYADKLNDYLIIQKIEAALSKFAIDAPIHWDSIINEDQLNQYFINGRDRPPVAKLGNLYYEPYKRLETRGLNEISTTTFMAYNYNKEEINTINYIIKLLFTTRGVWVYEDLWEAVRKPPIALEMNPGLFAEHNFAIALSNLIAPNRSILTAKKTELTDNILLDKLFDYNNRLIYHEGLKYKIEQVGVYYILTPLIIYTDELIDTPFKERPDIYRDKDYSMMKEIVEPNERLLLDADSFVRSTKSIDNMTISVDNFLKAAKEDINYLSKKEEFIKKYPESVENFLFSNTYAFQINMVRDCIVYNITEQDDLLNKNPKIVTDILNNLIKFGAVITSGEIKKYKDVASQFEKLPENVPIGYMVSKYINVYDVVKKTWVNISKLALNKHIVYKENEIIVGTIDDTLDGVKFKMRRPQHVIKEVVKEAARNKQKTESTHSKRVMTGDIRFVERGIVCGTKSKQELMKLASSLGISLSGYEKPSLKIEVICRLIRDRLYNSELKERQKDSRYKYMYFWWDEQPHSSSYI